MIVQELFSSGHSAIHAEDPRCRFFFAVIISFVIALSERYTPMVISILFASLLVVKSRLNLKAVIKRLSVVLGFLAMIWLVLPLTFEGEILIQLSVFKIYRPGVELAALISVKSISIFLIFVSLVATIPVSLLGHIFYFFKLPTKLVLLLMITYRYLFVIAEEYSRLRNAMRIRCFQPKSNIHSFRSLGYLIGMLFVRASLRAEQVNWAMRLRGFNGCFYSLEDFSNYNRTVWFPFVMTLMIGSLIFFEWII